MVKILLANEVTKLCHGEELAKSAENEAKLILSSNELNQNFKKL